MTPRQKIELRQSELRKAVNDMLAVEQEKRGETFEADMAKTVGELRSLETELQAAIVAEPPVHEERSDTPEGRELRELRNAVSFERYIRSAMTLRPVEGAEREYNEHRGIADGWFPLELLAPEVRASRDGDSQANAGSWLDRVLDGTAADRLGITFTPVAPGVASYPVVTAGGSGQQRGRTQDADERAYTFAVTELTPSRNAIHAIYSVEDDSRVPGLADAIVRDMNAGMAETIDKAIFKGDTGANENSADITGLETASIHEFTLTQANKVKADKTLEEFVGLIDGRYASSLQDVRVVAAEGANKLWYSTIHNSAAENQTIAQFLMASGLSWSVRGGIEVNSANGDFGAFVGLGRGIEGAARACVWEGAQLIRDPYGKAKSGEVMLTLNYLWNFAIPRVANFKRLKFVT